jgi:hypothetical protein
MEDNIPLLISYENDLSNNLNSQLFKKTLEKYNWNFKFIGEGEKWLGFKNKIVSYYTFLQTLSENKLVILSDARDVFCLRDSQLFLEQIQDIVDKKIIISAECFLIGHMDWSAEEILNAKSKNPNFFWQGIPLNNYWSHHNKTNDLPIRKYVNSGLIIGRVQNLIKAFKWVLDNNYNDDQLGFANYTNNYPELVHLDYEARILHTSTGFVNGSLYNYSVQSKDIPTFAELFGLSSYFLHISGINGSKGQLKIYNLISIILKYDINGNDMFSLYDIKSKNPYGNFFVTNK